MRALRAWHMSANFYADIFCGLTGMSYEEMKKKCRKNDNRNAFDWTNRLTARRKDLADSGYAKEVEQADCIYLEKHRGFASEEQWEGFWAQYLKNHDVPPYPEDAL